MRMLWITAFTSAFIGVIAGMLIERYEQQHGKPRLLGFGKVIYSRCQNI